MEASVQRPIRMAKQDALCFSDQLKLNAKLSPYMGRPAIRTSDLVGLDGMTKKELQEYLPAMCSLDHAQRLAPANKAWAMGFSWSSFVGQSVAIGACKEVVTEEDQFLSDGRSVPARTDQLISVCTDDTLHFSREGGASGNACMCRLDTVWERIGLQQHAGESIYDPVLDGTASGIDLISGTHCGPHAHELFMLLCVVADLLQHGYASPMEIASIVGVIQWLDLLNRWMLSCLHFVYEFARRPDARDPRQVPNKVLDDIMINLALFPFWETDLCRAWLGKLIATDASPTYGFGVSVAPCAPHLVRNIAAAPLDGHILIKRCKGDAPEQVRRGAVMRIPLTSETSKRC